jgi:thimet oligopeptidase
MRASLILLATMLGVACGAPGPALAPPPPAPTHDEAAADPDEPPQDPHFDPVPGSLTADGITKLCDEHLARAEEVAAEIRALRGRPERDLSFESTLGRFDDMLHEVYTAESFPYLMAVAHPSAEVREAAKLCEPKSSRFTTAIWLDADLASVVKAYAGKKEPLGTERAKFLTETLRDFRRGGLDLDPDGQARLRALNEEITQIGQDFMSAIGASRGTIEVPASSLDALTEEYRQSHPPNERGKVEISTDYPDYFPFVTYTEDRRAALDLYVKFVNRGGIGNVRLLERMLEVRAEKAKLLGYATWADFAIEPRMAKSSAAVKQFLEELRVSLAEPAERELAEFLDEHVRRGGKKTDVLLPPDRYYLEDRVRSTKYDFDSQKLSEYLELESVKKGLMDITAKMYGLTYRELDEPTWHEDVTVFEVLSQGKRIGKFYFDLHPRPDKYKHAAMFTIRSGKRMRDGTYQTPIAALVCNFPKPGERPALMTHEDVVTFFHEFGHVLHDLLTEAELASFSGTSTARDFVESPSQMFEEWAWSRPVLDLFAKHHETGARIPDDLFASMTKARSFGRALSTQRQLFLATLDFEYHVRPAGFDTTTVLREIQNASGPFKYVAGTHFQSSFGHLISYDAGYYGYQWALSLSRDVLTRFEKEGLMNPSTADAWRRSVLARGGSRDERAMIEEFLGRPPNHEAYIRFLTAR